MTAFVAGMLPKHVNFQIWSSKTSSRALKSFTRCSYFRDMFVFSGRSWLLRPGNWRENCIACPATTRWESPSAEPAAGPLRGEWSMLWESNGMWRWGLSESETSFERYFGRGLELVGSTFMWSVIYEFRQKTVVYVSDCLHLMWTNKYSRVIRVA